VNADTYPLLGWPDGHARLAPLLLLALPAVWLKALCVVRTIAVLAFTAGVLAGPAGLVAGVLGYVTLRELAIVPLLLSRRTRRLGVIAALGLHATFEVAVSPDLFGWAMAALLLGCWERRRSRTVEPN
jgi:hypothetical protein